jgi:DNA-binding NarL/FixJ family response regulator
VTTETRAITALVADDHAIARRGLEFVIRAAFSVERVIGVADGERAVAAARKLEPDLIVLDLHMPGHPRGSVLCNRLSAAVPHAKIVLVTAFGHVAEIKACLAAGASGALLKDSTDGDLVAAFRRIMDGEFVTSPEIAQKLAADLVGVLRGEDAVVRLTVREREVLDMLAEGCSNKEIAERLVLSTGTVKDHVGSLMRKLDATSRLQAVAHASEAGLL